MADNFPYPPTLPVWPQPDHTYQVLTFTNTFTIRRSLAEQFEEITGYPPHGCPSIAPILKMIEAAIPRMHEQMEADMAAMITFGSSAPLSILTECDCGCRGIVHSQGCKNGFA